MHDPSRPNLDATDLRIAVAVSRYHHEITGSMRVAAEQTFLNAGGHAERLMILEAPGAFELTAICRALAFDECGERQDAIVALGCVITGETPHDQYIAQSVTQGLTAITVQTGVPIAFGVLTCRDLQQARARSVDAAAAGRANKGAEAMAAAIEVAHALRRLSAAEAQR